MGHGAKTMVRLLRLQAKVDLGALKENEVSWLTWIGMVGWTVLDSIFFGGLVGWAAVASWLFLMASPWVFSSCNFGAKSLASIFFEDQA